MRNWLIGALIVSGVYLSTKAYRATKSNKSSERVNKSSKRVKQKYNLEAELVSNVREIRSAEIAYESNFDVFVAAAPYPVRPNKNGQSWVKGASGGFATMGWAPDGDVRGSYAVTTTSTDFTVVGFGDVDGDGRMETYMATKSNNPHAIVE